MKRIALAVAAGFVVGLLCQHVFETRLFAQISVVPRELLSQRFVLVDESRKAVGGLYFDTTGTPVINVAGELAKELRNRILHVECEIRPWNFAGPPELTKPNKQFP